MSTIHIELPDKIKAVAESQAAQGNYNLDAYVASLIIADATGDVGAPEHLKVTSQDRLIELLKEGQASPVREMNSSDWDSIRQRLIAQHSPAKTG